MQTLGLGPSEARRSDGRFKSIFWPTVENAWDVDYLGQQGMWICTLVAIFTLVASLFTANIIVIAVSIVAALFYIAGGMGVRQANWPAAAMVLAVYLLGIAVQTTSGHMPGLFSAGISLVLFSNVRAAFLASEWKPVEGEDRPTRFQDSLADIYVDRMPTVLWPRLHIPFIVLGIFMMLLSLLDLGLVLAQRFGITGAK